MVCIFRTECAFVLTSYLRKFSVKGDTDTRNQNGGQGVYINDYINETLTRGILLFHIIVKLNIMSI